MLYPILCYFVADHLPEPLKTVSKKFEVLAHEIAETLPDDPEAAAGLRKLLESKDCIVRASVSKLKRGKE